MAGGKSEIEELKQDANEARSLLASATRRRLKDLLSIELSKIETRLKTLEVSENNVGRTLSSTLVAANTASRIYNTVIRNYSWDQSDKFLKLYITLSGVQNLDKEKIVCDFQDKSFNFKALELDGKNHELNIANLAYKIVPDKSYFKVKTDMVVIFAGKVNSTKWEAVTAEEKKVLDSKKSTKPDAGGNKEDPTAGLMGLMKQMYDDGDDEMKRMLNKTWYESQQKNSGGIPSDLAGMENMGI